MAVYHTRASAVADERVAGGWRGDGSHAGLGAQPHHRLPEVKAHFTRLCHMHGEESHPHTAASRCVTDVRLAGGDALEADVDTL